MFTYFCVIPAALLKKKIKKKKKKDMEISFSAKWDLLNAWKENGFTKCVTSSVTEDVACHQQ